MSTRTIIAAAALAAALSAAAASAQGLTDADEQEFQAMAAALKANDAERQSAIDTCVSQGVGSDPAGLAEFLNVAVENAMRAWCMRTTNGIAEGKLTLADLQGLNSGVVSDNARAVLATPTHGE